MSARRLMLVTLVWCLSMGIALPLASASVAEQPVVEDESVLDVSGTSVTLQAQINPNENETAYRFEYGPSEAYGSRIPMPDGLLGSGTAGVTVSVDPQGLTPSTTYHYRVVATVQATSETIDGADETFTTQPSGGEFALPDHRQWELVSPPQKQGAEALPQQYEGGAVQAAANGDAIAYFTTTPIVEDPGNNGQFNSQALSRRGPVSGWSSEDIATPDSKPVGAVLGQGREYRFFTPDLSQALVEQFNLPAEPPPLAPGVTERTDYLRDNQSGTYLPLVTAANTIPGAKIAPPSESTEYLRLDDIFVDATPDLRHVILNYHEALTPGAVKKTGSEKGNLYEWEAGNLMLVSMLPSEEQDLNGEIHLGSANGNNMRNAISSDGSRVIWSDEEVSESSLYMRNTATGRTGELDLAQNVAEPTRHEANFQIASADGSRVFFTDDQRLTADSTADGEQMDLYACDVVEEGGRPRCELTDLTGGGAEPAGVQASGDRGGAVLGAAEDGSYVYFVAAGKLTAAQNGAGEKAAAGCDNLYMEHYDTTTRKWSRAFIATLSGDDGNDWGSKSALAEMTSRVSPNGEFLTFMSDRPLTAYDNRDVASGAPDEEVFLYDAAKSRLICASCNPSGARPHGIFDGGGKVEGGGGPGHLVDSIRVWEGRWLAASVPGWDRLHLESAIYQPRYLANSGRLFFDSADPLVPQATNGTENVYEYEPERIGSCTTSANAFDVKANGCIGLISSGGSTDESAFLDAGGQGAGGEEGEDVFFITDAQLTGEDIDHSYDVYDAHVCSAGAPCLAQSPALLPPPCTTTAACEASPTPQPQVFGSPSSATFSGEGNVMSQSVITVRRPKSTVNRRERVRRVKRAVMRCRRLKDKHKRSACVKAARTRYVAAGGDGRAHGLNGKGK